MQTRPAPTLHGLTEADVSARSETAGEPGWLRERRLEAFTAFAELDWPHSRVEQWRYTNPRRFDLDRVVGAAPDPSAEAVPAIAGGVTAAIESRRAGSARIVDGHVVEATVSPAAAARGVLVCDLATAAREHPDLVRRHLGSVVGAGEKFDALNLAAWDAGALVYVPADVELDEPVSVTVQVEADGAFVPRVLVVADAHAKATVYADHAGGGTATVVEVVEVVVGQGASVRVVTAQDWSDTVDHLGSHCGLVGADGDYRHLEVTFGGRTVYLRPDLRLDHPGGNGQLLGVYLGSGEQQFEHRSLMHHNASHTTSELIYKGAMQDRSRASWFGNIRIEPHARATSSEETNRNLILTDGAKAVTIPFLEIECSDVISCGHHSSVGQIDESQVFYLQSRGIPRQEAARMLVFAFFAEVTGRIDLPGVTDAVLAEVERSIRGGAALSPGRGR